MAALDIDTIAGIATPAGTGGIGVIRISGPGARRIAEQVLGAVPAPRLAVSAPFRASAPDGEVLDRGIALFFPAPRSFTGEDTLELHAHGGPVLLDCLLETVCRHGARPARAGEFSERAFLNGKIDLAQAEAVADLIESGSREAAQGAMRSLEGAFSKRIHQLGASLLQLRAQVEAAMDFPEEEGVDFLADASIAAGLAKLQSSLEEVFAEARRGSALREGRTAVLAGPPNAGKSTLLNALAGRDAAIVSPAPGTTRDVLREEILLDGISVQLADTAGLRDGGDSVEQEGMRRAAEALRQADHVLLVLDAGTEKASGGALQSLDRGVRELLRERLPGELTLLYSKCDLRHAEPEVTQQALPAAENENEGEQRKATAITLSGRTGAGLNLLRTRLREVLRPGGEGAGLFTARRRHLEALERSAAALKQAGQSLAEGRGEILAEELRMCQQALGEITGEVSSDALLGEIFSTFCIGK